MEEQTFEKALEELRKDKKRKFLQTVDLIINLQEFDVRKESFNTFIKIPHPIDKKICAFLTKKSSIVDTITKEGFDKYKEKKEIKNLTKKYDFFIAIAPLMPQIATKFGRIFGPVGKMPSPQAGILTKEDDKTIKENVEKMKSMIRIRVKERSIKVIIGREDLQNKDLKENAEAIINAIEKNLPRGKQNIKNVLIKFTMTKPIKVKY